MITAIWNVMEITRCGFEIYFEIPSPYLLNASGNRVVDPWVEISNVTEQWRIGVEVLWCDGVVCGSTLL